MSDLDPVLVPTKAIGGGLLLLLLSVMPRAAIAQTGSPGAMPVYVYGHADSTSLNAGIASVRRRIAEIGWSRAVHRNSYPIFILIPRPAPPPNQASEGQLEAGLPLERQSEMGITELYGLVADQGALAAALAKGGADREALAAVLAQWAADRVEASEAEREADLEGPGAALAEGDADREKPAAANAERAAVREALSADSARTVQQLKTVLLETGLFTTTDVHFEIDRSILLPSSTKILDIVGAILLRHGELRIEVSGHTDNVGDSSYNQKLSENRAVAVRDYLLLQAGIEASRVSACGYGEERPAASNATITGRALNRRVEFRVIDAKDPGSECLLRPNIIPSNLQRQ